jgi:hypothetical protein
MAKTEAIKQLETLAFEAQRAKYPLTPLEYLPRERFSDSSANALTKAVIAWLKINGHFAERINVMGVPMDQRKVVTDCIGRQRQIGSLVWRKSTSTRGSADVHSLINKRAVYIEIKAGKDRMRPEQWEYKKQVEAAGALYWIASSFENFLTLYLDLVHIKGNPACGAGQ